jgi:hypothetical protein
MIIVYARPGGEADLFSQHLGSVSALSKEFSR